MFSVKNEEKIFFLVWIGKKAKFKEDFKFESYSYWRLIVNQYLIVA